VTEQDPYAKRPLICHERPQRAEGVGFEPTMAVNHTRFRDGRIRPGYATPPGVGRRETPRDSESIAKGATGEGRQAGRSAMRSGADTPISSRPDASTCFVAATSFRRAFVSAGSGFRGGRTGQSR